MDKGIIKLLEDVFFNADEIEEKKDVEKLDLGKDEDYAKFNNLVDECKKVCNDDDSTSVLTKQLFDRLFGFDMNDIIDDIKKVGDDIHEQAVKERQKEENKVPELPSNSTPFDKQVNLHKIVGEYVDTYIRPYGKMDTKVVDDVYAGLFEFACWIMNR